MTTVAAIQMNSDARVSVNLERAAPLIRRAVTKGAAVVVLPENFAVMPRNDGDRLQVAEEIGNGPIQSFLSDQAKSAGVWIVGGTMPLRTGSADKCYATCLVYGPDGERAARYDKIHLFDVVVSESESYKESDFFQPGAENDDNLVTLNTPAGRLGLTICYDLRFPELYRRLGVEGAELFTVPSAFTATTGRAHWEVLLRARAIENLAYVVAPGQSGTHINGRETFGHSMIIDPWGRIMDSLSNELEGVVVADVDLKKLRALRQRFPSITHRRL